MGKIIQYLPRETLAAARIFISIIGERVTAGHEIS